MENYLNLYSKTYHNHSHKKQIKVIREMLGSGLKPLAMTLCIMAYLSSVRR